MSIRLSHSASNRYQECGKSYFYHYIQNYRPTVQSSPLLFGTSIDKSSEHYILTRDLDAAKQIFLDTWKTQNINGNDEDLRFLLNFTYSNRDLDIDLLGKLDIEELEFHCGTLKELDIVIQRKDEVGFKGLTSEEKKFFNFANWLCLKRKGLYMLKEFKNVVDENVLEVLGTQVKIDLEDENKDTVVGFADFVVRWKGIEKPVIFDLKTSGIEYEEDAVEKSSQLGLYVFSLSEKFENTRTAGFIVLNKNINKNKTKICAVCGKDCSGQRHKTCDAVIDIVKGKDVRCNGEFIEKIYPKAKSQILINQVNEVFVNNIVENFNEVGKAIHAQVFTRCFNSCIKFNGAVVCPYYKLCHEGIMEDLEIKESK